MHVLPSEERAKQMTDADFLLCAAHLLLDSEEALRQLCPGCRARAEAELCPVCGGDRGEWGVNLAFDQARFEAQRRGER